MKRLASLTVAALLSVTVGTASAATIGFEGIAPAADQSNEDNSDHVFDGFNVRVPHGHYVDALQLLASRPQNATDWLLHDHFSAYSPFRGSSPNEPVVVTRVGGGPFDLLRIDASEWDQALGGGHTLTLTGHLFAGGTVVANLVTDDVFGFETFLPIGLVGLTQLDIIGSSATAGPCLTLPVCGSLAYDNIVVRQTEPGPVAPVVPEPGTGALLGAGLMALWRRRRA